MKTTKYRVEVWATVGSETRRTTVEIKSNHEPTYEELNRIHDDWISEICDSGVILLDSEVDDD